MSALFQSHRFVQKHAKLFTWLFFALAMAFLLFMELHNLMHSDLWGDEWVEYTISQLPIFDGQMYQQIITTFQPPLYNWLMHYWLSINTSLEWFRLFNVVPATISAIALYLSARKLTSEIFGSYFLVLLACSFTWIYMFQEAAEYTLMMAFVFLELYFFLLCREKFSWPRILAFAMSIVGAMYSQYGAIFVSLPLGLVLWLSYWREKKIFWSIFGVFAAALAIFGLPLYFSFVQIQMEHNEISSHISLEDFHLPAFINDFGLLLEYFWVNKINGLSVLFMLSGWIFLACMIWFIIKNWNKTEKKEENKRMLARLSLAFLISYLFLHLLVSLHIYAMIHAGESRGMFFRYSDVLLPLYYLILPALLYQIFHGLKPRYAFSGLIVLGLSLCLCVVSSMQIFNNWTKSHESEVLAYWNSHDGANIPTLFLGRGYANSVYFLENKESPLYYFDYSQLLAENPESFYVIRGMWGGEEEEVRLLKEAQDLGYQIVYDLVYERNDPYDYGGSLYYLSKA